MNRILILKFGALGDVVLATPLIKAIIKHHYPSPVDLIIPPEFAPLFSSWKHLALHEIPRRGAGNMLKMLRIMRKLDYDRIYDLQSNDRSRVLCALSGIKEKVGNHPSFPYTYHPREPWQGQSHIFARMCCMLESAGIETEETRPFLPADPPTVNAVREWIKTSVRSGKPFVLLHAGASSKRPEKKWPFFSDLASKLQENDFEVVWIGGPGDKDTNTRLSAYCGIDATNKFSILELAELGRHAAFAITNDSGPMHVLSASAIPVYGIYGPSDWRRNHALLQGKRVIVPQNIRNSKSDNLAKAQNIASITPKMVLDRLKQDNLAS